MNSTSVGVLLYVFYSAVSLRHKIPGGKVQSTGSFLTSLIVLFTAGSAATPFFRLLPAEIKDLLVGAIFPAGASSS